MAYCLKPPVLKNINKSIKTEKIERNHTEFALLVHQNKIEGNAIF